MSVPEWKKLERDVQVYFETLMETEPVVYHRFYDTASANGFLPAQPGDHLVIYSGVPFLIETKNSVKYNSLSSCFASHVKDTQIAAHRVWGRAGVITLFLFHGTEGYELWDGAYCAKRRVEGKRLEKDKRLFFSSSLTGSLTEVVEMAKNQSRFCARHKYRIALFCDECFEGVAAERNRLLTLATKHCPRDHHDWQEILRIAGDA